MGTTYLITSRGWISQGFSILHILSLRSRHAISAPRLGEIPEAIGAARLRAARPRASAVQCQRRETVRAIAHEGSSREATEAIGAAAAREGVRQVPEPHPRSCGPAPAVAG